jgi:HlyD family secretion protein
VLRAPVAGPILEKYVESRRVLPPGTPLLKMGDLSSVEIESDILSEEVVRVHSGQRVEISGKAVGRETSFEGKVKRIYPSAFMKISALGIEQQRVKTIIAFDNSTLGLRPGTRLDVRIITAEKQNAVSVPERSIFRREGKWYVFTVQGGRARLAPVSLGLKNDEWAEITDGLTAGDVIILEPKNDLEDGVRIKPKG